MTQLGIEHRALVRCLGGVEPLEVGRWVVGTCGLRARSRTPCWSILCSCFGTQDVRFNGRDSCSLFTSVSQINSRRPWQRRRSGRNRAECRLSGPYLDLTRLTRHQQRNEKYWNVRTIWRICEPYSEVVMVVWDERRRKRSAVQTAGKGGEINWWILVLEVWYSTWRLMIAQHAGDPQQSINHRSWFRHGLRGTLT